MVGAQRLLRIGAAVGIVEERLRHAAFVKLAQVLDAGDVLHERSRPFLCLRLSWSSTTLEPSAKCSARSAFLRRATDDPIRFHTQKRRGQREASARRRAGGGA